jgi:hypothetical protein
VQTVQHHLVWKPTIVWFVIVLCLAGFWGGVGYGISLAFADSKPERQIVCDESVPEPHIGSAIVCFSRP